MGEHRDAVGQALPVGQPVAFVSGHYRKLQAGVVVKHTAKKVTVRFGRETWNRDVSVDPAQLVAVHLNESMEREWLMKWEELKALL